MSKKPQGSKHLKARRMLVFCFERHRAFWERNYIYLQTKAKIEIFKNNTLISELTHPKGFSAGQATLPFVLSDWSLLELTDTNSPRWLKPEPCSSGFSSLHYIPNTQTQHTHACMHVHTHSHKSMVEGPATKVESITVATTFSCKRISVIMAHFYCKGLDLCSSWFAFLFHPLCP